MEKLAEALLEYARAWREVYMGDVPEPALDGLYRFTIEDMGSEEIIFRHILMPHVWLEPDGEREIAGGRVTGN